MAFENGSLRYVLGCMGGDGQMQTQLQLLVDLCDGKLNPQQAISRARWYLERGETTRLVAEAGAVDVKSLEQLGHSVTVANRFEEMMGHAQAIEMRSDRVLVGAADPRSDGQVTAH